MSVFNVAKYILEKHGSMTAMRLQKLCYYAQAWSLVWDEQPLFDDKIEAWINGPVVPALYSRHRGQYMVDPSMIDDGDSCKLDDNQKDTIRRVVDFYGQYDAQQLSNITHMEYPWQHARNGLSDSDRGNQEITKEVMADYYSSIQ